MASLDALQARVAERAEQISRTSMVDAYGHVSQVIGSLIEANTPPVRLGELCELRAHDGAGAMLAEVIGFTADATLLSALSPLEGVSNRTRVVPLRRTHSVEVGPHLFGCVLDGFGRLLSRTPYAPEPDANGWRSLRPVMGDPPKASTQPRIVSPMQTTVRAIDGLLTFGRGQRMGVFAGPGCGKTTLMASIARGCEADAIVFGLIGERGRELNELIEHELDPALVAKSIFVCATSDRTSMERARAAFTATAIAEAFRERGGNVLLLVDSLTRFARAQREIGLAAGEPPARGGFTPSVYTMLPRLLERAGRTPQGSISALYTVLVEGDSVSDPIGDEARSLLDGHILLSRKLAEQGHYPAIDVLASISRVASNVMSASQRKAATVCRGLMARYQELELLIRLGEYKPGADEGADRAVAARGDLMALLRQGTREASGYDETVALMEAIAAAYGEPA